MTQQHNQLEWRRVRIGASSVPFVAVLFAALSFLPLASRAEPQERVKLVYRGPDKTLFIVDQAEILARHYNKQIEPGPDNPDVYIFADDRVFEKLSDNRYIDDNFSWSEALHRRLRESVLTSQVCVLAYASKTDGSKFSLLLVDAALSVAEIEICTLDQLQAALS